LPPRSELVGAAGPGRSLELLRPGGDYWGRRTRRACAAALARLDLYAARRNLDPLALKPKDADDWTYALAAERLPDGQPRAAASVRRDMAAASSCFTWPERRHDAIRSPFRDTKARPAKAARRLATYPDAAEFETILDALAPEARVAVVMSDRGLRVGGLPALDVLGSHFKTQSKGKDIPGTMPEEALAAIRSGGLNLNPFAGLVVPALTMRIFRTTKKLAEAGKIAATYSPHDFRHFYSVAECRKDRDIYRVSKLLGHASIQVTEIYLRGLREVD
jgi:integrase